MSKKVTPRTTPRFAVNDEVRVYPDNPDYWTDRLRAWITDRSGVIEKTRVDPYTSETLYLVEFKEAFCPFGSDNPANGSAWWCGENDMKKGVVK